MQKHWKHFFSKTALGALYLMLLVIPSMAPAGGYLAVDNTGQPYRWAGPVTVNLDQGPLGQLSKAQADALVLDAMNKWTSANIAGSAVQFLRGPDLSEDHGDGQGTDPQYDFYPPYDGLSAIIYDQNGSIIDGQLGAGASLSVVGFAGPVVPDDFSPTPIVEGLAVFNGRFINDDIALGELNDISQEKYRGVVVHEIGHLLNLDHSQIALQYSETGIENGSYFPGLGGAPMGKTPDYTGTPTMFPLVLDDLLSLETDDKAWIRSLYPAAGYTPGSISGTARDTDGNPVNGINITAFSADDPTSMVSCVTGFTDGDPDNAPTGTYTIPGLPPGTVWVVDSEDVSAAFTGNSGVGPDLETPAVMPGAPEFLNEPGIESDSDSASVTTSFAIPAAPESRHISDVNLLFNDLNDVDLAFETENGSSATNAQPVDITPGRFLQISGFADPAETGAQYIPFYGTFVDFYEVNYPAGLELNVAAIAGETFPMDVFILEESPGTEPGNDFVIVTGTNFLTGPALSMYLDSSRMGTGSGAGKFYIAAVTPDPNFLGNPGPTNYTISLLFTVSDRDAVVVKGTQTGVIDPVQGNIRILGRGFKNIGGPPTVEFSRPEIQVNSVTFVNSNTLDVSVTPLPGLQTGATTAIQVTNQPQSGSFAGRRMERIAGEPSKVTDWELYK